MNEALCSDEFIKAGTDAQANYDRRMAASGSAPKVSALKYHYDLDGKPVEQLSAGDAALTRIRTRISRLVSAVNMKSLFPAGGATPGWSTHCTRVVLASQHPGEDPSRDAASDAELSDLIMREVLAPSTAYQARFIKYLLFQVSNHDPEDDLMLFAPRSASVCLDSSVEGRKRHLYTSLVDAVRGYATCLAAYINPVFRAVFDDFLQQLKRLFSADIDLVYVMQIFTDVLWVIGNRVQTEAPDGVFDHTDASEWVRLIKEGLASATSAARCNQATQRTSVLARSLTPKAYLSVSSSKKRPAVSSETEEDVPKSEGASAAPKGKAARTSLTAGAKKTCLARLAYLARGKKGGDCAYTGCAFDHASAEIASKSAKKASDACVVLLRSYKGPNSQLKAELDKAADRLDKLASKGTPFNPYA